MTLDRRDWIEDGCTKCGWGVRGREENVRLALEQHECSKKLCGVAVGETCEHCVDSCEDEKPWRSDPPQAPLSPSNETEPAPLTETIEYGSGVKRTPTEGKTNWSLVLDGPLVRRLAQHLTKGQESHGKRNWMKGETEEDLERFRESAVRHFFQWYHGETDEDHFAACVFNLNGAELVKERLPD